MTLEIILIFPSLHSLVIVTLPNSAPSSPIPEPGSYLDLEEGDFETPSSSPRESVISFNPSFLPLPPPLPPRNSTPIAPPLPPRGPSPASAPAGSWDNFLDVPSYRSSSQEFWESRSNKIPIVSTDISDPANDSFEFEKLSSSEVSLNWNAAVIEDEREVFQNGEEQNLCEQVMAPSSERTAAESSLRELDTRARDMCADLPADDNTELSAPLMEKELDKIGVVRDEFRKAVRAFLLKYADELVDVEKNAWESDLTSLLSAVKSRKFNVLEKVSSFLPPATPMTEFEKESIKLQKRKI